MKKWVLCCLCTVVLGLASTGLAAAAPPAAHAPQTQTVEQLRQAIFQTPSDSGGTGRIETGSQDPQAASTCTGDFCAKFFCECAQQCQPCGVGRVNCLALLCTCKSC